ncbi:MAG: hypothetical protein Q9214_007524 [Letrouitia sp. 1 TL-2023]
MPALLELCKREIASQSEMPFKAIVYFSATADVNMAASTFRNLKEPGSSMFHRHPLEPTSIVELHARLTQDQRTKAAAMFRNARSAILFSSDVTSRGMDFPNVTHVIQIGLPQTRDAYIHRLGRTARADKKGEGWLILTDLESREGQQRLYNLPLYEDNSLQAAKIDMSQDAQMPQDLATILTQVIDASRMVRSTQKSAAYLAALGIYQWAPKGYLINSLNSRAKYCWGMEAPPSIPPGLASKLGYTRVPGANIGYDDDGPQDGQRGKGRATGWLQADGEQPEGRGFSAGRFDRGDRGGYDRRSSFGGSDRRSYGRSDSGMSSGNGYRGFDRGRQYGRGDRSASAGTSRY